MGDRQREHIEHLENVQLEQSNSWFDYWHHYSDMSTWEFWVVLCMLIVPLIILFIFIDKRKALLMGFYGYNVNIFFTYLDAYGVSRIHYFYPYKVLPVLPSNFALDTSFVPVAYILVYQWTLNHQKNYYLYTFILTLFFAFVFKPILSALGLFQLETSYFRLFIGYLIVAIVSKWVTNLFIYLEKKVKRKHQEI